MNILVTGSAGYIGSVLVKRLKQLNHFVIGVDSALTGSAPRLADLNLQYDIQEDVVARTAVEHRVDVVCHLAASADVTDSMTRPSLYYHNNIGATAKLFDNLYTKGWNGKVIFSSTAAVYGENNLKVYENSTLSPINAYGHSKLMCEYYFHTINKLHNTPVTMFRYFNVAGAYHDVGDHFTSGHIIQKLCDAYFNNKTFELFGNDYDTRDGTCVRDYIHVLDVCEAHIKVINDVDNDKVRVYNLGTGTGITVKEMIDAFSKMVPNKVKYKISERRPGDPAFLVADSSKFIEEGFKYNFSDSDTIIQSALEWYRSKHAV